ncbi:MAG: S1 RNA-binding domain-containing protein [Clostridia bacterium]|nr:S1 RNA-binding domain-containing protein [Clostridia bacterium]
MEGNIYRPEGSLLSAAENKSYLSSLGGLSSAMNEGRILEGIATVCEPGMNLSVNLGGRYGIIPRGEAAYSMLGEDVKDIAVITRVGRAVAFKVIGFEKDQSGKSYPILSRRAAQKECMERYLMKLTPGDIIEAKVTHLEQFGAFVDIGCGITSLLSIDCISVSRISHPRDRLSVGMRIPVIIKSIDRDSGRIYVTHRELLGTWEENAARFKVGQTVSGVVRSVESYGVFVEIAPNLAGLAELRDDIAVGQITAAYIKSIIPEKMKIKLVLIDSYKGEKIPFETEYFVDTDTVDHIDYWRYSPYSCDKIIETVFSST